MNFLTKNIKALEFTQSGLIQAMKERLELNRALRFVKDSDNILDALLKVRIYQNPNLEVEEKIKYFDENFPKHPVLFIFGLGNARLIHHLLKNAKHQRIIVFEPELELFYYAFESFDFSLDLKSERLILFYVPRVSLAQLGTLFTYEDIEQSVKTYNFTSSCEYYNTLYENLIENLNQSLMESVRFAFIRKGNDPQDSLIGIKHTLLHLPKMLKRASLKELITKRNKKAKSAIVVSTGPSLTKQLPLLKQYQDKFIIFCADSAYHILHKHSIKPDYVLSLERIDWTSKLFDNDFGEFDEGILFVLSNFTHKDTIKNLEKNSRAYMVVFQEISHQNLFKLHDYGYLTDKVGVAIFCFNLAVRLEHENIIFIGQDLAYGKKGLSHSEDYSLLYSHEGEYERDRGKCLIPAYGGEGFVESSPTWILFKLDLELDITKANMSKGIKTYNCTGGGALIEHTIELPFETACKTLFKEDLDKNFAPLSCLKLEQINLELKKVKDRLQRKLKQSASFLEEVKNELENLAQILPKEYDFERLDIKALQKSKERLLKLKNQLTTATIDETIQTIRFQNDCELIRLECIVCKDEKEEKEVLITYLSTIAAFFVQAGEYIYTQDEAIKKELEKWDV